MQRRKAPKILGIIFLTGIVLLQAADVPGSGFIPGWLKKGPARSFSGPDLYNHINGGAELFLEFGFIDLKVQSYGEGDKELDLEIYQMECPESALGIYLMKCGNEIPMDGIPVRHSGNPLQLLMVKDSYYIQINNFDGDAENLPVIKILAVKTLESIPDEDPVTILDRLPAENRVKDSGRIFRGPFGLQPYYTLGEGDILRQEGKIFGLVGDYRSNGDVYTRILVPYPNRKSGSEAFLYLKDNLDPYLTVLKTTENRLLFQDYDSLYGTVSLEGSTLDIRVRLKEQPGI